MSPPLKFALFVVGLSASLFLANQVYADDLLIVSVTDNNLPIPSFIDHVVFSWEGDGSLELKEYRGHWYPTALELTDDKPSDFFAVGLDHEGDLPTLSKEKQRFSEPLSTAGLTRFEINKVGQITNLTAHLLHLTPRILTHRDTLASLELMPDRPGLNVISRTDWGADEALRIYAKDTPPAERYPLEDDFYEKFREELRIKKVVRRDDQGQQYTWPISYPEEVSKFIIHHTATDIEDDPSETVRLIYHFHTVTRGWGDIGYNFLIDPQGNIYEGRAGGPDAIGAHTGRGNTGSIGIALIGDYDVDPVPTAAQASLEKLLGYLSSYYNIDPRGRSSFRGFDMPNIIGHRDLGTTTCPGENLYVKLTEIASHITYDPYALPTLADFERHSPLFTPLETNFTFSPGEQTTATLKISNNTQQTWRQDKTALRLDRSDLVRYFAYEDENEYILAYPQEKVVRPGQTATFVLSLQAPYQLDNPYLPLELNAPGLNTSDQLFYIHFDIQPAVLTYEIINRGSLPDQIAPSTTYSFIIQAKNTGNITWRNHGPNMISIIPSRPDYRVSQFASLGTNLGTLFEDSVPPGQTGTFVVTVHAPREEKVYDPEYFAPAIDGVGVFPDQHMHFATRVTTDALILVEQSPPDTILAHATTDPKESSLFSVVRFSDQLVLVRKQRHQVALRLRNDSDQTFVSGTEVNISTANDDYSELLGGSVALSEKLTKDWLPGQLRTFVFYVHTPKNKTGEDSLDLSVNLDDQIVFSPLTLHYLVERSTISAR